MSFKYYLSGEEKINATPLPKHIEKNLDRDSLNYAACFAEEAARYEYSLEPYDDLIFIIVDEAGTETRFRIKPVVRVDFNIVPITRI